MKTCTLCRIDKPYSDFNVKRRNKDGYQNFCRSCQRLYYASWYQTHASDARLSKYARKRLIRENNNAKLREYLREHPCVDCGFSNMICLEFDHVRGKKSKNVSDMLARNFTWEKIQAEISKCDVVCANCHKIRTATRGNFYRLGW